MNSITQRFMRYNTISIRKSKMKSKIRFRINLRNGGRH